MKTFIHFFVSFVILFVGINTTGFGQIPSEITSSLSKGDAQNLAKYFNQNVELVILDNESAYSKAHAEQVLKDFFSKYQPTKFAILHEGNNKGSSFAIGKLTTKNGSFRVSFYMKYIDSQPFIHRLTIEKEKD